MAGEGGWQGLVHIYIYICEQNDPCSGCINWLIVGVWMRAVSAFQAGIAERSAVFSCSIGVLSQHGVGMRSLERIWGLTYTIAP